ncbi:MAG: hypothetical protein ACYDHH_05995 [Solirubrobacteraceae bacterium]
MSTTEPLAAGVVAAGVEAAGVVLLLLLLLLLLPQALIPSAVAASRQAVPDFPRVRMLLLGVVMRDVTSVLKRP